MKTALYKTYTYKSFIFQHCMYLLLWKAHLKFSIFSQLVKHTYFLMVMCLAISTTGRQNPMIIGLILSAASAALLSRNAKNSQKICQVQKDARHDMVIALSFFFFFWSRQKSHFWQIEQEGVTYLARQFRGLEFAWFFKFPLFFSFGFFLYK